MEGGTTEYVAVVITSSSVTGTCFMEISIAEIRKRTKLDLIAT